MNSVKKKRIKYGSLAIGLTVIMVASIIVVNAVFSALSNHFFWYFDMTPSGIYSLSESSVSYLDKIDAEKNKVTVYFFTDKDNMTQSVSSSNNVSDTSMWGMKPIHELALQISDRYEFINIDYIDPSSEPDRLKSLVGEDYYAITSFTNRNVLIVNETYERDADGNLAYGTDGAPIRYTDFKLCSRNSFYLFDHYTGYVNAFRGDYYFTSMITALSKVEKPTVYFLTGHGEQVGDASGEAATSFGNATALYYMFEEAGCNIRKIDLRHGDFERDSTNDILVIYAPQRDITSPSTTMGVSESEKIKTFLAGEGNSMMVFFDSKSVSLTNLSALVGETAGVTVSQTKAHDVGESSVSVDGYSIVGQYVSGSSTVDRILDGGKGSKVVFRNAYPLVISEGDARSKAIIALPETSGASQYNGSAALMTLAESEGKGKILLSASAEFADNDTLESDVYGNKNLLISSVYDMNVGEVMLNMDIKLIRSEGLDRTEKEARLWTLLLSALIPAAVATIGTVVYIRRRHS